MILAVASLKGGSTKTTTAIAITSGLRARGRRVLLVDTDPQGSATQWMGVRRSDTFAHWWAGESSVRDLEELVVEDTLAASLTLAHIPMALSGELGAERVLRAGLRPLSRRYDWIVIDTPPGETLHVRSALVAADRVICPVTPGAPDGLERLVERMDRWRRQVREVAPLGGVLMARTERSRVCDQTLEYLRARYPEALFETTVPDTVRVQEAWVQGRPLAGAVGGRATEAYTEVTSELERRAKEWHPKRSRSK